MLLVTTEYIEGKKFEMLGMVKGATIQTVHMGKDIMNGFKTLVGGELSSYTEMMDKARGVATKRMCEDAQAMGADAIVGIRYSSSAVMQSAAEIMVYGTAVKYI
ncbi:YbjQ family protein [Lachnospiraceae bacterium LCP25S3_G4]